MSLPRMSRRDRPANVGELRYALAACAGVLSAPTNRFGKPEFTTDEARAAREKVDEMSMRYGVVIRKSVLVQAAAVARAVLNKGARGL